MVKLRFDTDLGNSLSVTEDLNKAVGRLADGYQLSAREAAKLERAAEQIVKSNLGPQEKYNAKIAEYAKLVKAGKLSVDDAEKSLGRYATKMDQVGQSHGKVFGKEGLTNLGQYVAGVSGVSAALAVLSADFQKTAADAEDAAQRIRNALPSSGERGQIATDAKDMKALGNEAKDVRRRGIQPDAKLAEDLIFQLRSSGVTGQDKESLFQLAEKGLIAPENVLPIAENARKFQRAFGLSSMEGALDVAKQAAEGTNANMSKTLAASLEFAQSAKAQGISGNESMAALVIAEQQTKSIDIAGTQVKALFEAAQQKGIKGNTMSALMANIDQQVVGGKTPFDVLGRGEAVTMYQTIKGNRSAFEEQARLIGSADQRNVATSAADLVSSDPTIAIGLTQRRSQASREVADEELFGDKRNLISAVREQIDERQRRKGGFVENFIGGPMRHLSDKAEDFLGGEDYFLKSMTKSEIGGLSPDLQKQVLEYQNRSLAVQEQMLDALKKQSSPAPPRPSGRQQ